MNDIALNLNHIDDELSQHLPPTDSRFRPDMRAFENGDFELAEVEKKRLENAQRERRKVIGHQVAPKYFTKQVLDEKKGHLFYKFGEP